MKDKLLRRLADILKRDFERALPSKGEVTDIMWPNDSEEIIVVADGRIYYMAIGSDDDEFYFEDSDGETHTVPFSDEWLDANENWTPRGPSQGNPPI